MKSSKKNNYKETEILTDINSFLVKLNVIITLSISQSLKELKIRLKVILKHE